MSSSNGRSDSAPQEGARSGSDKKPGPWDPIAGKCNSRKLGGGGLCRQPAGWGVEGMDRGPCKRHGGATSSSRKHHGKAQVLELARTFGVPVDVDPGDFCRQSLARLNGMLIWCHEMIARQSIEEHTWLLAEEEQVREVQRGGAASMPTGYFTVERARRAMKAEPSVLLKIVMEFQREANKLATKMLALNLYERQVRINEDEADLMRVAVLSAIREMRTAGLLKRGVDEEHPQLRQIVAACFREVTAA